MISKIKILLIEDNLLLRKGITELLKKQTDIRVVSSVGSSENIPEIITKFEPFIILFDLGLQNQQSMPLVKMILKQFPEIKLIGMDLVPSQPDLLEFIQAGVSGFILKDADSVKFLKTIRKVNRGLKVLPPFLTGSLFSQIVEQTKVSRKPDIISKLVKMTKREREITKLIADGLTNKEIAQELKVSTYTIKSHVHNILDKLSLSTRVQIAKYSLQMENTKTATDNTSLLEE
jgi:DNA-binding NarL/FixJ family response regulator